MLIYFLFYFYFLDAINAYDGGQRQVLGPQGTAGIFATYPHKDVTNMTGFWDQVNFVNSRGYPPIYDPSTS